MNILLVQPPFPIPAKSRNHAHFLPIGLLKIGTYHKRAGDKVRLTRALIPSDISPDRVLVTSLFTYWAGQVQEAAAYYHRTYPSAEIEIGGLYATLMPDHCRKQSPFARVSPGLYRKGVAEDIPVDYGLLPEALDYQIIHASRGCARHCAFCGAWRIEPKFTYKRTILPEIQKPRLVFYDNNLLGSPHIKHILSELAGFRFKGGRRVSCESQSGLDLRLLTPDLALMLRNAHFKYPRLAWDGPYSDWPNVRRAIEMLKEVGYGREDIFVFMLYNHRLSYLEMRRKLDACRRWQVRVIDCRFRPLDRTEDGYNPRLKHQTAADYCIYPGWTDRQVRAFRRAVRRQNIAILLELPEGRYIPGCERRKVSFLS